MRREDCNHSEGPQHDCFYVERRHTYIPVAERMANKYVPFCGLESDKAVWNRVFHYVMEQLMTDCSVVQVPINMLVGATPMKQATPPS
jgi:hypothetical protein